MKLLAAWMLLLFGCAAVFAAESALAPLDKDASIDQILELAEARGKGLKDFSANVVREKMDALRGDTETIKGKIWLQYVAPGDARIRVLFDSRYLGERKARNYRREYLLEKGLLVDRDYETKTQVTRRILKPGEKMDPLKLGEGPFPLPIGQDPRQVKQMFDVRKREPKKDDPPDTVHIELIPKPNSQLARNFKSMDEWVDLKTGFPKRIRTVDPDGNTVYTTDLSDVRTDSGLTNKDFALEQVSGWTQREED